MAPRPARGLLAGAAAVGIAIGAWAVLPATTPTAPGRVIHATTATEAGQALENDIQAAYDTLESRRVTAHTFPTRHAQSHARSQ